MATGTGNPLGRGDSLDGLDPASIGGAPRQGLPLEDGTRRLMVAVMTAAIEDAARQGCSAFAHSDTRGARANAQWWWRDDERPAGEWGSAESLCDALGFEREVFAERLRRIWEANHVLVPDGARYPVYRTLRPAGELSIVPPAPPLRSANQVVAPKRVVPPKIDRNAWDFVVRHDYLPDFAEFGGLHLVPPHVTTAAETARLPNGEGGAYGSQEEKVEEQTVDPGPVDVVVEPGDGPSPQRSRWSVPCPGIAGSERATCGTPILGQLCRPCYQRRAELRREAIARRVAERYAARSAVPPPIESSCHEEDMATRSLLRVAAVLDVPVPENVDVFAIMGPRGLRARGDQLATLITAIVNGDSLREIACTVGVTRETVDKARRIVEALLGRPILCRCGREARTHRGWCGMRMAKSPARQRTVAALHASQRALAVERERADARARFGAPADARDCGHRSAARGKPPTLADESSGAPMRTRGTTCG